MYFTHFNFYSNGQSFNFLMRFKVEYFNGIFLGQKLNRWTMWDTNEVKKTISKSLKLNKINILTQKFCFAPGRDFGTRLDKEKGRTLK